MNSDPHLIGYFAGILTTVSFIPQLLLTLKTRNTMSLSLGMYSAFTLGVTLWLAYGVLLNDYALIIANTLTLTMAFTILLIKILNIVKNREPL
jgi:MtN3 and saliva related transmembrane protein